MNWYEELLVGNTTLEQGDFIANCPVLIQPLVADEEMDISYEEFDMIVLSQTCDLANKKLRIVLLARIYTITEFADNYKFEAEQKFKEAEAEKPVNERSKKPYEFSQASKKKLATDLKQGIFPNYHLLNQDKTLSLPFYVIDFREIYSVPLAVVQSIAQRSARWRLCSPYKEHFAQAFARFFMRVGLPNDYNVKEIEKAL